MNTYQIRLIYKRQTDQGHVATYKGMVAVKRAIKREQKWDREHLGNPEDWSYGIRKVKP